MEGRSRVDGFSVVSKTFFVKPDDQWKLAYIGMARKSGCQSALPFVITMQKYDQFHWGYDDCGGLVAIVPDCSVLFPEEGSLRSPQPVDNGPYFTWCERFSAAVVTHRQQLVPQHVVAPDGDHQVLHRRPGRAGFSLLALLVFTCFCHSTSFFSSSSSCRRKSRQMASTRCEN